MPEELLSETEAAGALVLAFRALCAEDVERRVHPGERALWGQWLARQQRGELYVAVVEVDGAPVGRRCLDFTYNKDTHAGYTFAGLVETEWRSRGIGSRLDRHLQEVARARGLRALRCVVEKHNLRSRAWHERLGYRCIGESVERWHEIDGREIVRDCWALEHTFPPHGGPGE